jgi:hypothetical protein
MQCCFCHSPLEQAALAFLPGSKPGAELRETVAVLLGLAAVVGCATAVAVAILPMHFPVVFVQDAALWAPMQSIIPQVSALSWCWVAVCTAREASHRRLLLRRHQSD